MYDLLRFRAEDEAAEKAREAANKDSSEQTPDSMEVDTTGAAIVVDDYLPGEMIVVITQIGLVWGLAPCILTRRSLDWL